MNRLRLVPLAAVLALAGCMKVREDLLVMPDGSGRLTFTFSLAVKGEAAKFTQAQIMSGDPDEITGKVRGLAALTRPRLEEKEGRAQIRLTAYFDDINALKIMDDGEGEKAKPKQTFALRREGETLTLEIQGNLLTDEAMEPRGNDPDLEKVKEEMFRAMFAGFGFLQEVSLPGRVTVAEGFGSKDGRKATWEIQEKDLQKPADQKKLNAAVSFKATCAKSEVTEAEAAEFRRELEAAKSGWAELRKEMKRNAQGK